ncbi:cupin domain-containing protein [Bradyrhizobium sp. STM 3557]|uniref:cupin domain-containing protein n=1 Tax=Bradyrhizobium sp. STM 3557 TaxID=578920 RepID=UPI0038904FE9
MAKLNIAAAPISEGSDYPAPFDMPCRNKLRRRLAKAAGLSRLGVNLLELQPGAWSSQRHWHTEEEEFVYVIEGEVVLVGTAGEEILRAGDCAAFPPGEAHSHHLQNRSTGLVRVLEIGSANLRDDECHYPDIDLHATAVGYFRKDGTSY